MPPVGSQGMQRASSSSAIRHRTCAANAQALEQLSVTTSFNPAEIEKANMVLAISGLEGEVARLRAIERDLKSQLDAWNASFRGFQSAVATQRHFGKREMEALTGYTRLNAEQLYKLADRLTQRQVHLAEVASRHPKPDQAAGSATAPVPPVVEAVSVSHPPPPEDGNCAACSSDSATAPPEEVSSPASSSSGATPPPAEATVSKVSKQAKSKKRREDSLPVHQRPPMRPLVLPPHLAGGGAGREPVDVSGTLPAAEPGFTARPCGTAVDTDEKPAKTGSLSAR